jgi:hypothetical protein
VYKGAFRDGQLTGRGIFFYCDSQDFYMGEVDDGKYHGKGLIYRKENDTWEFNLYKEGRIMNNIEAGKGRP